MTNPEIKVGTLFNFKSTTPVECKIIDLAEEGFSFVVLKTGEKRLMSMYIFNVGIKHNILEVVQSKNLFDIDDV
jgi:hypothetical protein